MTSGGLGKTTCTICASSPTVARISLKSSDSPLSFLGGVAFGSDSFFHLYSSQFNVRHLHLCDSIQFGILIEVVDLSDTINEEIVLVDIYLNA